MCLSVVCPLNLWNEKEKESKIYNVQFTSFLIQLASSVQKLIAYFVVRNEILDFLDDIWNKYAFQQDAYRPLQGLFLLHAHPPPPPCTPRATHAPTMHAPRGQTNMSKKITFPQLR